MQSIQGINPEQFWTFLYVLAAIVVFTGPVLKLIEFYQKQKDRKAKREAEARGEAQTPVSGIISRLDAVETQLKDINEKLDHDNRRLNTLENKTDGMQDGFKALCAASLVTLKTMPRNESNEAEITKAQKALEEYLINR